MKFLVNGTGHLVTAYRTEYEYTFENEIVFAKTKGSLPHRLKNIVGEYFGISYEFRQAFRYGKDLTIREVKDPYVPYVATRTYKGYIQVQTPRGWRSVEKVSELTPDNIPMGEENLEKWR